jgi:hypothetical protein
MAVIDWQDYWKIDWEAVLYLCTTLRQRQESPIVEYRMTPGPKVEIDWLKGAVSWNGGDVLEEADGTFLFEFNPRRLNCLIEMLAKEVRYAAKIKPIRTVYTRGYRMRLNLDEIVIDPKPLGRPPVSPEKKQRVLEILKRDPSFTRAAQKENLSVMTVSRIAKRAGLNVVQPNPMRITPEKHAQVLEALKHSSNCRSISRQLGGISYKTVAKIRRQNQTAESF